MPHPRVPHQGEQRSEQPRELDSYSDHAHHTRRPVSDELVGHPVHLSQLGGDRSVVPVLVAELGERCRDALVVEPQPVARAVTMHYMAVCPGRNGVLT